MPHQGAGIPEARRAPRATADYIAFHARRRPDHVAVVCDDRETTYAVLRREVLAMTAALARLDLPAGAVVALEHPRLHPRVLVTLAFEQLGVTVAPFRAEEGDTAAAFVRAADFVMSGSGMAPEGCGNALHMTDAWLAAALSEPPRAGLPRPPARRDPLVLKRTSGSTRQPKQLVLTRAMVAARVAQRVVCQDFHRHDRFLTVMHFTVGSMYYASLLCLRLGATVMHHSTVPAAELLDRYRPTKIYMLPFQVAQLLEQRGPAPGLPGLTLIVSGGKIAPALAQRARDTLCDRLIEIYATNESGVICAIGQDGLGRPARGTEIEIVGEDGATLPPGAVGEIRVRGPAVFDGYHGDPAATAASVRDGWWHTGDYAMAMPGGCKLLGRRDDVLNLGGIKHAAAEIEAAIQTACGGDLAVLVARDPEGESVAVVCVAGEAPEAARVAVAIRQSLPGRFAVYSVDAIPRTPEGKLRRAILQQIVAARTPIHLTRAG